MDNEEGKKTYHVRHWQGRSCIDYSPLAREIWGQAEVLSDFSFPWTATEAPETVFRALWDDDLFYFRFEVEDQDVVLGEGADAMEKVMGSDRVEIFFTTGDDLDP